MRTLAQRPCHSKSFEVALEQINLYLEKIVALDYRIRGGHFAAPGRSFPLEIKIKTMEKIISFLFISSLIISCSTTNRIDWSNSYWGTLESDEAYLYTADSLTSIVDKEIKKENGSE
ncbi:MAG: hypothetical protein DHS20C18_26450 [Saprospiraceae bacterium]|nr:MAG: hypothetical protein DHS20C18_26450 [Saprospiraceae bacterium]